MNAGPVIAFFGALMALTSAIICAFNFNIFLGWIVLGCAIGLLGVWVTVLGSTASEDDDVDADEEFWDGLSPETKKVLSRMRAMSGGTFAGADKVRTPRGSREVRKVLGKEREGDD